MNLLHSVEVVQWAVFGVSAILIGMTKAGLSGASIFAIPAMAAIFGAQNSVGIILPMLITADIVAVIHYREHADWKIVGQLLPWTILGVVIGVFVGDAIDEGSFRVLLAVVVLSCLAIMVYRELFHRDIVLPNLWWISAILGVVAGFATMVGNAAGPIMALYLFSMGLTKNQLIGTGAWFFFVVNLLKVPFHVFVWGTITGSTLLVNAIAIPVIVAGVFLGLTVVRRIPERPYRAFIIISTAIVSVRLLL